MQRTVAGALIAASLSAGAMAADVGISLQFSQPGVYGRVDIGQYPQPQVILQAPIVVERPPPEMPPPQPVYLYVPPEHRDHWARHCREYHACGQQVYFVDHDWYQRTVVAHDEGRHRGRSDEDHGRHRGHDDGDEGEHGHGHGHGHD